MSGRTFQLLAKLSESSLERASSAQRQWNRVSWVSKATGAISLSAQARP